jgi:hypothetical protein
MSSIWTPGGEVPVNPEDGSAVVGDPNAEPTEEEIREYAEALRQQLANTPAAAVISNHCYGLFELASVHLSWQPPKLEEARMAIDAMSAIIDKLGDQLGEYAQTLQDARSQLQMAYVQIANSAEASGDEEKPEEP